MRLLGGMKWVLRGKGRFRGRHIEAKGRFVGLHEECFKQTDTIIFYISI
jgi:hypothetical protein